MFSVKAGTEGVHEGRLACGRACFLRCILIVPEGKAVQRQPAGWMCAQLGVSGGEQQDWCPQESSLCLLAYLSLSGECGFC